MNSFIKREYDYAIRICAYLAGKDAGQPIPLPKVAKILQITKPFATKIMHQLKNAGITGSRQGKTGGIFLKKDPAELSLYSILEAMQFNSTLNECVHQHRVCPLVKVCHIHMFFLETEKQLLDKFKNKMISELVIHDEDITPNPL